MYAFIDRGVQASERATQLRIVELALSPPHTCWPQRKTAAAAADESALCLAGPDLCQVDTFSLTTCFE